MVVAAAVATRKNLRHLHATFNLLLQKKVLDHDVLHTISTHPSLAATQIIIIIIAPKKNQNKSKINK